MAVFGHSYPGWALHLAKITYPSYVILLMRLSVAVLVKGAN